jgi:hypothetical protein
MNDSVAWASTYYQLSHNYGNQLQWKDNTKKFSPKWTYNFINQGSNAQASLADAFQILKDHGAATLSALPYDGVDYQTWDVNSNHWANALAYRAQEVQSLDATDFPVIKGLLNNGYLHGTCIYQWQYSTIKSDPFVDQKSFLNASLGVEHTP